MAKPVLQAILHAAILLITISSVSIAEEEIKSSFNAEPAGKNEGLQPLHIRYMIVPRDAVYNRRFNYFGELLKLVLDRSGKPYYLEPKEILPSPTMRNVMYLQQGKFDVTWMHTNTEREQLLRPVRIPIYRGLIGWRLFLIDQSSQPKFSQLNSLNALKKLKAGQVYDWPDTKILSHENFGIRTSRDWSGVLNLLYHHRIDYFPRGIIEAWEEKDKLDSNQIPIKDRKPLNFSVEESLILYYPTAFYLFVNKENEELATALEAGFSRAIEDGSFHSLLKNYFETYIIRSNLANRRVFKIPNHQLPTETPLDRKEQWLTLKDLMNWSGGHTSSAEPTKKPVSY